LVDILKRVELDILSLGQINAWTIYTNRRSNSNSGDGLATVSGILLVLLLSTTSKNFKLTLTRHHTGLIKVASEGILHTFVIVELIRSHL